MPLSPRECLLTFLVAAGPRLIVGEVAFAQEAPNARYYQWVSPARTATRVQQRTFQSAAVGSPVSYHIYIPDIYDSATAQRFPVAYWLHGSGGGGPGLPVLSARLDSAIRAGKMPPMLVVFPNGLLMGMWVNWKSGRVPMETVVIKELIPHIDATFRTIPSREARLIEGFSMGGYGAARLAFKYPDLFGAVSLLAGGPLQQELTAATSDRATPAQTQMVLDTIYGGDQEYFKAQSPWQLAERNVDAVRRLRIRQVVGDTDNTLANNQKFHEQLTRLKIPHDFIVLPGVSHNPRQLFDALGERHLEFYRDAFAAVVRPERQAVHEQRDQQTASWRDASQAFYSGIIDEASPTQKVLALRASKPAMEVVQDFLGRPVDLSTWERWLNGAMPPLCRWRAPILDVHISGGPARPRLPFAGNEDFLRRTRDIAVRVR